MSRKHVHQATVIVSVFTGQQGESSHLVEVTGSLPPVEALRLAVQAIVDRLIRRLW